MLILHKFLLIISTKYQAQLPIIWKLSRVIRERSTWLRNASWIVHLWKIPFQVFKFSHQWLILILGKFHSDILFFLLLNIIKKGAFRRRSGSGDKDSNTAESLVTLKRTCQLLIYTPSQWYSCMSRTSRSALEAHTIRWAFYYIKVC